MPVAQYGLVAVVVLLAASLTIVSLSFAAYCCHAQKLSKAAKTYSVHDPKNLERYNVEPYLTTGGAMSASVPDPVYSNVN